MRYLVVGATGTLGTNLLEQIAKTKKVTEIICLSRDELKQKELRGRGLFSKRPFRWVIGDIRDYESIRPHFHEVDVVFHVAALKHIDVVEENPLEGLKTNVMGTINVAKAAMDAGVPYVAFSSTDKAVLPVNTYGMTKAFAERYLINLNRTQQVTKFSVFRWGNVFGSRGSVIGQFLNDLDSHHAVDITDVRMTRFWIDIKEAAKFMLGNYQIEDDDDAILIPSMKGASVVRIAEQCAKFLGLKEYTTHFIGIRNGEKIHECILSDHDACIRSDTVPQLTADEITDMIQAYVVSQE